MGIGNLMPANVTGQITDVSGIIKYSKNGQQKYSAQATRYSASYAKNGKMLW
jgi:hypothetical protein